MTMLYRIGKPILMRCVREFFREIRVTGSNAVVRGPLLVVPNHPNHALDPFLILATYPREFWFLAKSTLFRHPVVAAVLRAAHLIPVYRRQDNEDVKKNDDTLRFAAESLVSGRAIVIFPEGTSRGERRLSPVKTGAARIAFQAESAGNFQLGLQIQAVGLNYADFQKFQGTVTVCRGAPFGLGEYQELYERDPVQAVRTLTQRIDEELKRVTVEVPELRYQRLIEDIARVYQSVRPATDDHRRFELVAKNVAALAPSDSGRLDRILTHLQEYAEIAESLGIDGDQVPEEGESLGPRRLRQLLFLSACAPLVIFGMVVHWIPYQYVKWQARRVASDPVLVATAKFAHGVLAYPTWYLSIAGVAGGYYDSWMVGLTLMLGLCLLGLLTSRMHVAVRAMSLSLVAWSPGHPYRRLRTLRDQLIAEFERLRVV